MSRHLISQFWDGYYLCMRMIEGATMQDWLVVFCAVVLFGLFCMRGFGSRAKY